MGLSESTFFQVFGYSVPRLVGWTAGGLASWIVVSGTVVPAGADDPHRSESSQAAAELAQLPATPHVGPPTGGFPGSGLPPARLPSPRYTNQPGLKFPIVIDQRLARPTKLWFFVSRDRGATWKTFDSKLIDPDAPQHQREFVVEHLADGEYWFLVRGADQLQTAMPQPHESPQKIVIVDTRQPAVQLNVALDTTQSVVLAWKVSDPLLDPQQVKIEVQEVDGEWLPLASTPGASASAEELQGTTVPVPRRQPAPRYVRVQAVDRAGNRATAQTWIGTGAEPGSGPPAPSSATAPALISSTPLSAVGAAGTAVNSRAGAETGAITSAANPALTPAKGEPPAFPAPGAPDMAPAAGPGAPSSVSPSGTVPFGSATSDSANSGTTANLPTTIPAAGSVTNPFSWLGGKPKEDEFQLPPDSLAPQSSPAWNPQPALPPTDWTQQPTPGVTAAPNSSSPNGAPDAVSLPRRAASADQNFWQVSNLPDATPEPGPAGRAAEPSGTGRVSEAGAQTSPSPAVMTGSPLTGPVSPNTVPVAPPLFNRDRFPGANVPLAQLERDQAWAVKTRQFELEYDLENVSADQLGRVDLYESKDGGATWQYRDADLDRRSPAGVTVSEDGIYGYRLHAVSESGVAGPKPKAGDRPDVWVCVDSQPPQVEFTSIQLAGQGSAELLINWVARDLWLAERPVTLEYRATTAGGWETIAAGITDSGSYVWKLDEQLPPHVLLRIVVQDRAGNESTAQSPSTIATNGRAPAVRVKNLRPTE